MLNFGQQVEALHKDSVLVGDAFVRIRPRMEEDGLIVPMQLLESEYPPTEKTEKTSYGDRIINGIEINQIDGPEAYWFYSSHPFDQTGCRLHRLTYPSTNTHAECPLSAARLEEVVIRFWLK